MRIAHRFPQFISFLLVALLVFTILPTPVVTATPLFSDGIWTDTFDTPSNSTQVNCVWDSNGYIRLAKTNGSTHDFSESAGHTASYYSSIFPFFFNPAKRSGIPGDRYDYIALSRQGEGSNRYFNSQRVGFFNGYLVQVFRFKLTVSGDHTGNITVTWKGKANSAENASVVPISLRYWKNNKYLPVGRWVQLNSSDNWNHDMILNGAIGKNDSKLAVDTDQYFNVAVFLHTRVGTLSTDYIQITCAGEAGYKLGSGYVTSKNITRDSTNGPYWEFVTWDAFQTDKATLKVQVLAPNATKKWVPISDQIIPGNSKGFTTPPVYINDVPQETIRLNGTLATSTTSASPELYSWSVIWQPDKGRWQDRFTTDFRVDTKIYVNINNKVNLTPIQGQWPMIGQNPANTRVATGRGPRINATYWYSSLRENSKISTPILDGDSLFLTLTNGSVYKYRPLTTPTAYLGTEFWKNHTTRLTYDNYDSVVAPAITDKYVIVPTGRTGANNTQNAIYFIPKDGVGPTPEYGNNGAERCYWSSPIIVDDLMYITSWSGNLDKPNSNTTLLALNLNPSPSYKWHVTLPAWSFSTPAYDNGTVVVGCHNKSGPSLFAFNATSGSPLWQAEVGAIDRASPVIADGVVYIVSEKGTAALFSDQTQLIALHLSNGSKLWNTTLGKKVAEPLRWDANDTLADCTPAYLNGMLYMTTPDGHLLAVKANSGTVAFDKTVYDYNRLQRDPILKSSPAIAEDIVVIGNPDGTVFAFGTGNLTLLWVQHTHSNSPVTTSPVISNGLAYIGTQNGWLYAFGSFIAPDEKLNGTLISMPIKLPTNYWWKKFQVVQNTTKGKNSITYSLLDENKQVLKSLVNNTILSGNVTLPRTVRLRADFQANNISVNPSLFRWNLSFDSDKVSPYLNKSTLRPVIPTGGWINTIIPEFSLRVKDNGTGLLVSSASFFLEYYQNSSYMNLTHAATCTGENGTTAIQDFTANLLNLSEFRNITSLKSITFKIQDLAGNIGTLSISFNQDVLKPWSRIYTKTLKKTYTGPVRVNATTQDNQTGSVSDVSNVTLYYRMAETPRGFSGPWLPYSTVNGSKPYWNLTFNTGGYYEIMTRARDKAGNVEDEKTAGEANFTYDAEAPDIPVFDTVYWYHARPTFTVTFTDDFRLDTIQYRASIPSNWTVVARHINESSYTATWQLPESIWDQLQGNQSYYLFFRINDTLGNTRNITDTSQALQLRRDTEKPTVIIEVPSEETFHSMDESFNITARASDVGGSGIQSLELLYRYSRDGVNWTEEWTQFGNNLTAPPYTWSFGAGEGEGYYQFRVVAMDHAGNTAESSVISTGIQAFPTSWLVVLGVLVVILIIVSAVLLAKWRKR